MTTAARIPLLDHFAALSDPRPKAKILYPHPEILLLVLSATIAGADVWSTLVLSGWAMVALTTRYLL